MAGVIDAHDHDLEAAFLGACLFDPTNLDEPYATIPTEMFYTEKHRTVWRLMQREHAEHDWIDAPTLAARAKHEGTTEPFMEWLTKCFGMWGDVAPPHSWMASAYVKQLKRMYADRERAKAARKYESDIAKGIDPSEARLEFELVANALDEITDPDHETTDDDIARQMGHEGRYPSGYTDLDKQIGGYANPGFIVLVARPSVGKSSFARGTIRAAAKRGDRVLWYSQDQSANQIMELEIARSMWTSSKTVANLTHDQRVKAIERVRNELWNRNVELIDRPIPLAQLLSVARISRPDLMVVDYVQIIDAGREDEYANITATSQALKTLAFQLRIPILGLAQYNRQQREGQPPSMANLKGSGQLEQDAEQILSLHRDTSLVGESEATLYVVKNKVGPTGTVSLTWRPWAATFENYSWREEHA